MLQGASLDHANSLGGGGMDDFDFSKESSVERRCSDAFAAVQHFEKTHCLALQHMALPYLQRRPQLVASCLHQSAQLGLKDEVSHDAVLLMDRTMSTGLEVCPSHALIPCRLHALLASAYVSTTSQPEYAAGSCGMPMSITFACYLCASLGQSYHTSIC